MRKVRLTGSLGVELGAQLDLPAEGEPRSWALLAHCFTCGKDFKAARHVGRALAASGLGVLRLDFTGLGESEGEFAETTLTSNVEDLLAAAAWLERERQAPRLLVGHSLGGSAAMLAAPRLPSCRAVATIAASSDHRGLRRLLTERSEELRERGEIEVEIAGRRFRLRRSFLEDLERFDLEQGVRDLGRALLLLHSPQDRIVDVEHAARLFRAARHPKSYVSLDGMDHLLLERDEGRYVGEVIAAWASRYLAR